MNLRRLKYFIKIVDVGSLTQAADILHIAQPALSQQLATLEGEVDQQLLIRTKRGLRRPMPGKFSIPTPGDSTPVRAGAERHRRRGTGPERPGFRRPGAGTAAQLLAIPLLTEVQRQHPGSCSISMKTLAPPSAN